MALKKSKKDHKGASKKRVAAIFGVTGLVGRELARRLSSKYSWKVYGIARREEQNVVKNSSKNYHFISCDLLCPLDTQKKLSFLEDVTHIYWVTWANQYPLDSLECCDQNKEMLSNALDAMLPKAKSLKHVSLQTGMKHYVSFRDLISNTKNFDNAFYDEDCPRASLGNNFYYILEDLLKERLAANKVGWSVQRPGLITGCSKRTTYNFMGCLAIYASICKHLNLPFVFGGSRQCWEEAWIDVSDARLVAEQHIWASTDDQVLSPSDSQGQAFNTINGICFTWKEIWPAIGKKFGLEVPENMFSPEFKYSKAMSDKAGVWREIVDSKGLVETEMEELANWDFLDLLFRCPLKLLGTRAKADRLGFRKRYTASESITYWIDYMRDEKLIP
ncbi:(S)-8-oxocitronellyl enol synthase CYC2 [Beta vulgaris subsp. vulgaris]|uniref:(S)-8-oxocitronellyl enol synthase CYC2 n=1 Tax=Beta vulgaris subsp. vulgaris TaxID=3555 RepID=UPI002036FB34|nr:(S)-8-oxocitronellyl enol synthase CYC2 [Beta vulgaris subsp. vulgaris]